MKKLISILLMTIMVLNLSGVTFADSETIVSQSGVLQLYQVYNDKGASFSPLNYDTCYKLSETEKALEVALNFSFLIDNVKYNAGAEGSLPICTDVNGNEYVDGPLNGIINNGIMTYDINVGFQKYIDGEDILLTLVVQSQATKEIIYVGAFGSPLLNKNNVSSETIAINTTEVKNTYSEDYNGLIRSVASTNYVEKTPAKTTYHSGSLTGKAQTEHVYYDSVNTRIAVGVNSYSNIVNNYYSSNAGTLDTVTTGVQNFSIDLNRLGASSYIAGIEENTSYQGDGTVGIVYGKVFSAGLSALNFPGDLLSTFFSGCATGLTKNQISTNHYIVTCNAGSSSYHLESTNYCAPVIFEISEVSSSTQYKATSVLRYKTLYMEASGNLLTYYTSTPDAIKYFYID